MRVGDILSFTQCCQLSILPLFVCSFMYLHMYVYVYMYAILIIGSCKECIENNKSGSW